MSDHSVTMVAETALFLSGRHTAEVRRWMAGAIKVTDGPGPLDVTQRLTGDFKLVVRHKQNQIIVGLGHIE